VPQPTSGGVTVWSRERAAKAILLVVTLVLMSSMGGGFLALPLLIPAHIWAARRSGRVGRVAWPVLPAVSVLMLVWAVVYVLAGESKPTIWLLPLVALVGALCGTVRLAVPVSP